MTAVATGVAAPRHRTRTGIEIHRDARRRERHADAGIRTCIAAVVVGRQVMNSVMGTLTKAGPATGNTTTVGAALASTIDLRQAPD
jgi:hypothetical protein